MGMNNGTEFWEIESDELREAFEEIANEHAARWEETVDGLAIEHDYVPVPPPVPMDLCVYLIETVRPPRMTVAS
jgi:hypothetical protein